MANTYTQIHIQAVFVVKYRAGLIQFDWEEQLYKYISGIITTQNHKVLAINGMPDHVHVFFGMRPSQSPSDLMQDVKGSSSKWINENGFVKGRFEWQEGYGAFSYSKSQVDMITNYVKNQKNHHAKTSFKEEYEKLLKEFEISYDDRYIFKEPQ
jgi:putative transposase